MRSRCALRAKKAQYRKWFYGIMHLVLLQEFSLKWNKNCLFWCLCNSVSCSLLWAIKSVGRQTQNVFETCRLFFSTPVLHTRVEFRNEDFPAISTRIILSPSSYATPIPCFQCGNIVITNTLFKYFDVLLGQKKISSGMFTVHSQHRLLLIPHPMLEVWSNKRKDIPPWSYATRLS